jgi:hypothetical protein
VVCHVIQFLFTFDDPKEMMKYWKLKRSTISFSGELAVEEAMVPSQDRPRK